METIKIDNDTLIVAELPVEIQQLVQIYSYSSVELDKTRKQLAMIELSRDACAKRITTMYHEYKNSRQEPPEQA